MTFTAYVIHRPTAAHAALPWRVEFSFERDGWEKPENKARNAGKSVSSITHAEYSDEAQAVVDCSAWNAKQFEYISVASVRDYGLELFASC